MSVSVTVAGVSYTIPSVGDVKWGPQVTAWIQAISSVTLQSSGGTFTLTGDLNFGTAFGLLAKYYTSVSANASATGSIRLANTDTVSWRNAANSADLALAVDSSNNLTWGSVILPTATSANFQDSTFNLYDNGDATKKLQFQLSGITTANTRTLTVPDASTTIVGTDTTQTLTNKTLTSPIVNTPTVTSPSISGPTITGVTALAGGSVSAPALTFTGDTDNGLYYVGVNNWGLTVGGVEAIDLLKSTGGFSNLGLGGQIATSSDSFPVWIKRDQNTNTLLRIDNANTGALASSGFEFVGNGQTTFFYGFSTASTVDAFSGKSVVQNSVGNGVSLVSTSGTGTIGAYVGGTAATNKILSISSTGLSLLGGLAMSGSSSGAITFQTQAAAGTYNFNLPTTAGSSGNVLTSGGGGSSPMTWTTVLSNPMTTGGDLVYGGSAGAPTRLANGTSGQYLASQGGTSAPAWTSFATPTVTSLLSTGTTTGYLFNISTSSTCAVGDTYTNNGVTFTVLAALSAQTGQVLFTSSSGAPVSSGTLTRATGLGTASITFLSSPQPLATYTVPAGTLYLRVRMVGGGGGGGGGGTQATVNAGGGGGTTWFGANLAICVGGSGGTNNVASGGTTTVNSPAISRLALQGTIGGGWTANNSVASFCTGGFGGTSPFGSNGAGVPNGAGSAAATNSGAGGGGGGSGGVSGCYGMSGGGAGGYAEFIIPNPAASYPYIVATGGGLGSAGTSGFAGAIGGSGQILIEEFKT